MGTSFQLFNLETMSGVFPGTRTMVFQRVRVRPVPAAGGAEPQGAQWVRLLWYEEPRACAVELGASVLRVPEPLRGNFGATLQAALEANGLELLACGSCTWWRPQAVQTADGLPTGWCMWEAAARAAGDEDSAGRNAGHSGTTIAPPPELAPRALLTQSVLAVDCSHWQAAGRQADAAASDTGANTSADGNADRGADAEHVQREDAEREGDAGAAAPATEPLTLPPIAKRAERENDERWTWWGRLRQWVGAKAAAGKAESARRATGQEGATSHKSAPTSWAERIVERSGVGAGTEPCFACQGRIANLGALAVASPEGDKQTFSVWRCRQCFTYYLNDWIDRWERTDSLETEETYYRLAPQEALEILAVIDGVVDAEHPARRHERGAERAWVVDFIGARRSLSHQVKQGR